MLKAIEETHYHEGGEKVKEIERIITVKLMIKKQKSTLEWRWFEQEISKDIKIKWITAGVAWEEQRWR